MNNYTSGILFHPVHRELTNDRILNIRPEFFSVTTTIRSRAEGNNIIGDFVEILEPGDSFHVNDEKSFSYDELLEHGSGELEI